MLTKEEAVGSKHPSAIGVGLLDPVLDRAMYKRSQYLSRYFRPALLALRERRQTRQQRSAYDRRDANPS